MSKREDSKSYAVEVQKGPVSMHEQFNFKFMDRNQCTAQDMADQALRRSGQTLTYHEPKR